MHVALLWSSFLHAEIKCSFKIARASLILLELLRLRYEVNACLLVPSFPGTQGSLLNVLFGIGRPLLLTNKAFCLPHGFPFLTSNLYLIIQASSGIRDFTTALLAGHDH